MEYAQKIGIDDAALRVGPLRLDGRVMLAPMSGISDVGMRRIARRFGATLVVTEMVACETYLAGESESVLRAEGHGVAPHVVQLVGRDPGAMGLAARRAEQAGADIIDINMGCPAKRVAGGLAGSALMRDLDHAVRIIDAVVGAVDLPVTLKMRLGWDENSLNAAELARRAEAAGVCLVSVHGRTRCQFYAGRADWAAVRAVVDSIAIPVVVNGDCADLEDARAMLAISGAKALMVGRAAVGAPWLAGEISRALEANMPLGEPPLSARQEAALEHFDTLLGLFGRHAGLRHARKHLSAYAEKAGASPRHRLALVTSEDANLARRLLAEAFDLSELGAAA
ncbi:MAG TPA: tRNA dihydrouridine synthase DusB [Roseiarcus sp.]|jgi:tRNA-dihydrouridine synthase B